MLQAAIAQQALPNHKDEILFPESVDNKPISAFVTATTQDSSLLSEAAYDGVDWISLVNVDPELLLPNAGGIQNIHPPQMPLSQNSRDDISRTMSAATVPIIPAAVQAVHGSPSSSHISPRSRRPAPLQLDRVSASPQIKHEPFYNPTPESIDNIFLSADAGPGWTRIRENGFDVEDPGVTVGVDHTHGTNNGTELQSPTDWSSYFDLNEAAYNNLSTPLLPPGYERGEDLNP